MLVKNKKLMGFLIVGSILVCLFTGLAHAQVVYENEGENWLYSYNGPGNRADCINEIKVSNVDYNIYGAGKSARTSQYSYFTVVALTWEGDTLWRYQYTGSANRNNEAKAMVIDDRYMPRTGHIYAAGFSENSAASNRKDLMVIKLDPATGDTFWTYRYNGSGDKDDEALAIDFGVDNHIYVAGYTEQSNGEKDFLILKLDPSGNKIHEYKRNGPANDHDQANAIKAPQTGGNLEVFAAGYVETDNGKDFAVVKLDTSLSEQWHDYVDGGAHGDDVCKALNKDHNTRVLAVGYMTNTGTGKDFTVMEYTSTGVEDVYIKDGPDSSDDEANAVCVTALGSHICAAGYLTTGSNGKDYTVIGFNHYFHEAFVYTYNGPGNSDDEALALCSPAGLTDPIYAAGYSTGNGTGYDLIVTKHRNTLDPPYGDPYWIYRYDGPGTGSNDDDIAYSIDMPWWVYVGGSHGVSGSYPDLVMLNLPDRMPPKIPQLISPADSGFLNDTLNITFLWHESEDAEDTVAAGYYLSMSLDSSFATSDTIVISDTTYTDTLADTLWYWRAKAMDNSGGLSDWSEVWSFAFDLTAPEIPTLMSPIADAFVLDTSVTFDWGDVTFREFPTLIHYVIQIDTDEAFPAPIVDDTMTVSTANYILAGDERYYWRVKAYDLATNESPYADAEPFRVDMSPPLIESTTVWNDTIFTGPYSIYSMVTDLFGLDSVILIYRKPMEHSSWFPINMTGTYPWFFEEIPGVTMANDTIQYYIYVRDNAGRVSTDLPGAPTDFYWFIGGYDPGVTEFDNPPTVFSFGLKSNPVKGRALFNLALPEAADVTLRIYDATGRLIDKVISGKQVAGYYEIPWTSSVTAGVYFYSFESPYHSEVGKLVLVR